ncbi:ferredoxin reductase [Euzebya sp.]|uniref:ferredoxin reductase n=1 Tax=Euzebya sp. TaxID=1971409 RepID=UPI00351660CE
MSSAQHWVPSVAQEAGGSFHAGPLQVRTRTIPARLRRVLRSRVVERATTPHGIDSYLQVLNPLWAVETTRALLVEKVRETRDTSTLTFDPGPGWGPPEAGQHVQIKVSLDGVVRTRHFSISSSAHRDDGRFTLTVKAHDEGYVSRFLHTHARTGLVVEVSEPRGEFTLPDPRPDHLLLVSGGSGITPVMAMLRTLVDEGHEGRVTFLHYARTNADRIFATELEDLAGRVDALDVVQVLTGEEVPDSRLQGRLVVEHLDEVAKGWADATAFVCGPAGMLEAAEAVWADADAAGQLHVERFALHPDLGAGTGEGRIRLADSELEIDDDGRPLLAQAEDAGLQPDYGCRMGICKTCTTRKVSGITENLTSGDTSTEDDDDIQICVSVAKGDVELALRHRPGREHQNEHDHTTDPGAQRRRHPDRPDDRGGAGDRRLGHPRTDGPDR